jgi:thioredoxin 1
MSNAAAVTTASFEQDVLQSPIPVLVDFWAVWCGPCRMVAPHVDAIAAELAGKVKVVKVDVDSEPEIAGRFGIMSIPTLMIFKDGKEADRIIGAVPKSVISNKLQAVIE